MITSKIKFKNFEFEKKVSTISNKLKEILNDNNQVIKSLKPDYKYSYNKKLIKKYNGILKLRIIGIGGSSLGFKAIYNFLNDKIKKKVTFHDNLNNKVKNLPEKKH